MKPCMRTGVTAAVLLFVRSLAGAQQYTGSITGTISDAATREPLPGVNVVVTESPSMGGVTNPAGSCIFLSAPTACVSALWDTNRRF